MVVGLAADPAPQPHLAHHLEHRLVRYALAVDGPRLHRYLAVADAVGEPAEDLGDPAAQPRPGRGLGVRQRVVVGRPGQRRRLQQVGQGEAPRKRGYGRRPVPSGKPSSAFRAIDFFRYATWASSLRTSRSSSSSRVLGAAFGPEPLGLPLGLGLRASAPPSR